VTPARKLFEHMLGKDAAARELRALFHQIEDRVLSLMADHGCVGEVNHQTAALQGMAGIAPGLSQFIDPWPYQRPFHDQPSLALRING